MIVYHYCSLKALFSIIENNEIWLTSISSSYDKDEILLSHQIAQEIIQKRLIENHEFHMNQIKYDEIDYFCLSCTKKKNESYFHFHSYGDALYGVRIALDTEVFDKYIERLQYDDINKKQFSINFNFLNFSSIIYSKAKQLNVFIERYKETDNILKKFSFYDSPKSKFNRQYVFNNTMRFFEPYFKKSTYEAEEEIRLVFDPYIYKTKVTVLKQQIRNLKVHGSIQDSEKINLEKYRTQLNVIEKSMKQLFKDTKPQFCMFDKNLRSYYALNIEGLIKEGFIKNIIVGAKSFHNLNQVENYLKSKDLKIKVTQSKLNIK